MGEHHSKILIIDLAFIGDLLMATPAISEIKRLYPGAHVTVLSSPTSAEVLQRNPAVDRILTFDKKSAGLWKIAAMAGKLRRENFDVAFIFHRAFGSALMAYLAGIRRRVGFATEGRRILLTDPVHLDTTKHRADNDLAVLQAYGLQPDPSAPLVFITDPADERFPEEVLGNETVSSGYAVYNPNASWETKRWPVERFRELAQKVETELGLKPVGIGATSEKEIVGEALGGRGVNLAGRTNLSKLGVLCRKAKVVVTNDSGPMHIAAAMGSAVIALFGPTSPARCGPRSPKAVVVRSSDLVCISCYKKRCPTDFPCMIGIGVDEVFELVKEAVRDNFGGQS